MDKSEKGQAFLEYILVMMMVASIFNFFFQSNRDRLIGPNGIISELIEGSFQDPSFQRFRIIR